MYIPSSYPNEQPLTYTCKGVDNRGAEGAKAPPPPPRFLTTIKNDCYYDCNTICEKQKEKIEKSRFC